MPQNPIAVNPKPYPTPANALNITVPTVVKATPGKLLSLAVITAGTAPGTVNDCAATANAVVANQIATIPTEIGDAGIPPYGFPCSVGITVTPGAGQVLAVAYQ